MTKLGQHFLKSESIARKIVETAGLAPDDLVLEIGPGKGILTVELLKRAKKVVAVEKDGYLVEFLKKKFSSERRASKLKIIHGDALKLNPEKLMEPKTNKADYKIVANLPYYITSRFLRLFLTSKYPPKEMTLMVQKEVAQRIVSRPPKTNLLALSVQIFGRPKIAFKVSKQYFSPAPKVDSAVIAITDISRDFFIKNNIEEKEFFTLVKAGFSQKRKFLINNLANPISETYVKYIGLTYGKKEWRETFKKCGIPEKSRPENLSLENWVCLYKKNGECK
ncbi:MAG: 16S rRNA (adenine(1518)-N(6)/adenine(1519)-N(6))-dimethyltransferase RsmA [Patescibacteria group bacterium]